MKNHQVSLSFSILIIIVVAVLRYSTFHSILIRQLGNITLLYALQLDSTWPEEHGFDRSSFFDAAKLENIKKQYLKVVENPSYHYLGFLALIQKDYGESLDWFGRVTNQNLITRYFLGESYLLGGNLNLVVSEWEEIEAQNPMMDLAKIRIDQGDYNSARIVLESILEMPNLAVSNAANAHKSLAKIYDEEGDLSAAAAQYMAAIELFPNDGHATALLGNIFRRQGDYFQAIEKFDEALRLGHQRPAWVWTNKGRAYGGMKDWDAAAAAYLRALEESPMDKTVLELLVIADCRRDQTLEARIYFEQLSLIPDSDLKNTVDGLANRFSKCLDSS